MTRVLVVGAGGFVGANLMRDLMRRPNVDTHGWIRPGGYRWRVERLTGSKVSEIDIAKPVVAEALPRVSHDLPEPTPEKGGQVYRSKTTAWQGHARQ